MSLRKAWILAAALTTALGVFSIIGTDESRAEPRRCEEGQAAFATTLHPKLRARCAHCHGDTGNAPGHSLEDPAGAYQVAIRYADFGRLEESLFVRKVEEQHWRLYSTVARGMSRQEMLEGLRAWWDEGEKQCSSNYALVSPPMPIPSALPSRESGRFTKLSWDLGAVSSELQGVRFEAEIQEFTARNAEFSGSYRVRKPRISNPSRALEVRGIQLLLNGKIRPREDEFARIQASLPASAGWTTLSTDHAILLREQDVDSLSIGFISLRGVDQVPCIDEAGFRRQVLPVASRAQCVRCHGGGSGARVFPQEPVALCRALSASVDREDARHSPLLRFPHDSVFGHPRAVTDLAEVSAIVNWIENWRSR